MSRNHARGRNRECFLSFNWPLPLLKKKKGQEGAPSLGPSKACAILYTWKAGKLSLFAWLIHPNTSGVSLNVVSSEELYPYLTIWSSLLMILFSSTSCCLFIVFIIIVNHLLFNRYTILVLGYRRKQNLEHILMGREM